MAWWTTPQRSVKTERMTNAPSDHLSAARRPVPLPEGGRVDDVELNDEEIESVESSGATIDEAIATALQVLDLLPDEVEVEVLAQPGPGQEARVRVTALPYEDEDEDYADEVEAADADEEPEDE